MAHTDLAARSGASCAGGSTVGPELTLDEWAARLAIGHQRVKGVQPPVSAVGRGRCHIEKVRTGLTISNYDMQYSNDTGVAVEVRPHANLGMLISGWHEGRIGNRTLELRKVGVPILFASSELLEGSSRLRKGQRCRSVGISFDESFFDSLGGIADDAALGTLRRLLREPFVMRELEHATTLLFHLQDLADCPYTGVMACLHCESRALAVLVELAAYLNAATPQPGRILRKDRRDRVQHVRHLVDTHLDKPLSLAEIVRCVGSNETTLRLDFKAVFGTTIFAYVRDRRLDVARRLVREGQMSIAKIAYCIGYASPASFSTAYRKRFGIAPSAEVSHDPGP